MLGASRAGSAAREAAVLGCRRLVAVEHLGLLLLLATGVALMLLHGWSSTRFRWLGLKLGLVALLVVPLEAIHAWVNHVWLAAGRAGAASEAARRLERGAAMDEMVRTLALPLLGAAVPLVVWLSLRRPF